MGISILVDDKRDIKADHVFRTFHDAVNFLEENQTIDIDVLYLDYYLDDRGVLTGLDVAMEMFYYNVFPKCIKVVSGSDDGAKKLQELILKNYYFEKNKNEYFLKEDIYERKIAGLRMEDCLEEFNTALRIENKINEIILNNKKSDPKYKTDNSILE